MYIHIYIVDISGKRMAYIILVLRGLLLSATWIFMHISVLKLHVLIRI